MTSTLHFLGTSDSKGVPRFWCNCPVCYEARTAIQGRPGFNRRTRPSALLRGNGETLLLDCGPDLHAQLSRLGGPFVPDAVIVSHAHNDHLLGLGDLLDYVASAGGQLRIYAPVDALPDIRARFAYAFLGQSDEWRLPMQPIPEQGLELCGYRVRAFEVPHGANGVSHAFHFAAAPSTAALSTSTLSASTPGRWVYMTDAIGIPDELAQVWLQDLDLLVLGTSFRDESGTEQAGRSVYDVREALALPWARAARRVLLSHLSHDIDVRQVLPDRKYSYATDGLSVSLNASAVPRTGRP